MKIRSDIAKNKKNIQQAIKKHGYFAEHNFYHFLNCENEEEKNIFFQYGLNKGVLLHKNLKNDIWTLFPCGVLAPEKERVDILLNAAHHILKKEKAKKLVVEVFGDTRKQIFKKANNGVHPRSYTYLLHWPVFNMKTWDPKLRGNKMKKLRNIKNRFYKKHSVRVKDCEDVSKEKLLAVVQKWINKRSYYDNIDEDYYINLVNSHFKGMHHAKVMYVDGKPAAINAGWKIPNTKNYYSAIGILDYTYQGLGEVANLDDLNRLKGEGYQYVDFGGSDEILLRFKRKFKPESIYKTYTFSLVKR